MTATKLTLKEVKRRAAKIRRCGDAEESHNAEDELAVEVLRAVVIGLPESRAMAQVVADLMSDERTRWYA